MSVWESSVAWVANTLQSVCPNRCCSAESAPSGHTLTVLTVGFTRLMRTYVKDVKYVTVNLLILMNLFYSI